MKFLWVAALAGALLGCTKSNPRSCVDGSCTDPAFPFCDVDGALEGTEKVCIAVDCTPGEFRACRADQAIVCNSAGADYDLERCDKGCDEAIGGCRLCEPNQTACTNGKVASCDAAGKATISESCPLGCFEDQPRCREMVPSNNLGTYLAMVSSPPTIELTSPMFDTYDGSVRVNNQVVTIPNFTMTGVGNGPNVRVYVVKSLKLHGAQITATGPSSFPDQAIAFVAADDITLDGEIVVGVRAGGAYKGCGPAMPGQVIEQTSARLLSYAGGGGGNGTVGGVGGGVGTAAGGAGDTISGSGSLVPLRGGCSGGFENGVPGEYPNGGGAVQLSAGRSLKIDGVLDVRGTEGQYDTFQSQDQTNATYMIGGGGAGGSVLLEAPQVSLGPDARIDARGGRGFQGCVTPMMYCGAAGNGATAQSPAGDGMNSAYMTGILQNFMGGGGGGGLGRLRVNTADGLYTKASSVIEDTVVSTGTVQTR